jgi:hypothetical protein
MTVSQATIKYCVLTDTDITTTTRPMLALSKMPQLYELPQHCDSKS